MVVHVVKMGILALSLLEALEALEEHMMLQEWVVAVAVAVPVPLILSLEGMGVMEDLEEEEEVWAPQARRGMEDMEGLAVAVVDQA